MGPEMQRLGVQQRDAGSVQPRPGNIGDHQEDSGDARGRRVGEGVQNLVDPLLGGLGVG